MTIFSLNGNAPDISADAYIAPGATLIGRVTIGSRSSAWPGAVIRADNDEIIIGERSNVQDGAVLHTDPGLVMRLGNDVSVGHLAMLHGCTVEDDVLIGIGAVVLNGAVIGAGSLIGASALVTAGTVVPPGSMFLGAPGRVVRQLSAEESTTLRKAADSYVVRSEIYRQALLAVDAT